MTEKGFVVGSAQSLRSIRNPEIPETSLFINENNMGKEIENLNYTLGIYVGEYIIAKHLPTLSTDMLKTKYIIEVTEQLSKEWEVKNDYHFNSYLKKSKTKEELTDIFNENLKWYKENIEDKYLPKTLKILVPKLFPTNMVSFKKGLRDALWNCDLCHYGFSDNFFEQTDAHEFSWCSIVNLDVNKKL